MTTKKELIEAVSDAGMISKTAVEHCLSTLAAVVAEKLAQGNEVTLHGIVRLKTEDRPPRVCRNPRTGESVQVPARRVVKAKAVSGLI